MEDSSIANNGGLINYNNSGDSNNFALIAILVTFIAILVTIYCSSQFYPNDLDPSNFCHSKNQSTQTDQTNQIRQRDLGVQTTPCSLSSRASPTACYLDITSRLRPFSDETTTAKRLTNETQAWLWRTIQQSISDGMLLGHNKQITSIQWWNDNR